MNIKHGHLPGFFLISASILMGIDAFSQSFPRLGNPEYTQTVFTEDFSTEMLNREVWKVSSNSIKSNLYIFADTTATVNPTERGLELSMLRHPGYSTEVWTPGGDSLVEADFIGGEVMTKADFSYGIFECNATLAYGSGSFPAFWLYNDTMCTETERPEIDIVELKADSYDPTLDVGIWYYPKDCKPQTLHEFTQIPFTWGDTHTYKAVWTPEKIEFWVDDRLLKAVHNTGQYWYPYLRQHLKLSQQMVRFGVLFPGKKRIKTPQSSWFHRVKVREFFLAPEIHCPDNIWHTAVAMMDVDDQASDVTWKLIPQNNFAGPTSGKGLKATLTPAGSFHAVGKIVYRFKMPSGEAYTAEKTVQLNGLQFK
ncbi:MAG: glycoside hydrolase family 16 protein [Mariniphaga sp.]